MGDIFNVWGQAGAVGPNAHAHDLEFVQLWDRHKSHVDLARLADELGVLLASMRPTSTSTQQDQAIAEVGRAQDEARAGNGPAALRHLKAAGRWALVTAGSLGTLVAEAAIKVALGL